jgi:hypothetical protein
MALALGTEREMTKISRTLRQHKGTFLSTSRDGFGKLGVLGSADLKLIFGFDVSIGINE